MRKGLSVIFGIFLLLSSSLVYNVNAQSALPDIDIDCQLESQIRVYPGATNSGFYVCTLSNPTSWTEEVEVTIESGVLVAIGPGTVTVGPGEDLMIQISLRAEQGMMVQSILVETKAVVVSWNGLPADSLPEASDTADTSAMIMEYSAPTIQLTEAEISIESGEDYEIGVIYGNNGNGNSDTMKIGITQYNRDDLETAGFTISVSANSVEIESGSSMVVKFEIRAPKDIKDEEYFIIEFYVESEFSCRYEYGCNRQSILGTIIVSEVESGGAIGALGDNSVVVFGGIGGAILVVAVVVVVLKRKRQPQFVSEEDEFVEDDFEDDFDDDLEDDFFDDFDDDLEDDFFDDL